MRYSCFTCTFTSLPLLLDLTSLHSPAVCNACQQASTAQAMLAVSTQPGKYPWALAGINVAVMVAQLVWGTDSALNPKLVSLWPLFEEGHPELSAFNAHDIDATGGACFLDAHAGEAKTVPGTAFFEIFVAALRLLDLLWTVTGATHTEFGSVLRRTKERLAAFLTHPDFGSVCSTVRAMSDAAAAARQTLVDTRSPSSQHEPLPPQPEVLSQNVTLPPPTRQQQQVPSLQNIDPFTGIDMQTAQQPQPQQQPQQQEQQPPPPPPQQQEAEEQVGNSAMQQSHGDDPFAGL